MKTVAKYFNGTVNDVLVTVVTRALRKYADEHGSKPVDLTAFMPVGNMSSNSKKIELANNFGYSIYDSALSRSSVNAPLVHDRFLYIKLPLSAVTCVDAMKRVFDGMMSIKRPYDNFWFY